MNDSTSSDHRARRLHCGVVLRVREDECEVIRGGRLRTVRYAPMFPSPRTERVQPGNLVAVTSASDGIETVLWRWYDAVVLGDEENSIRLWEPAHGEVLAQPRAAYLHRQPGSRAYLSAWQPRFRHAIGRSASDRIRLPRIGAVTSIVDGMAPAFAACWSQILDRGASAKVH
jgi:hypothetical protein